MNILFCQWSQQQNRCLAWWNHSIWDLLAITCSSVPAPWLSFLAPLSSLLLTSSWSAGWGSPPPPGPDPSSYTHSEHKHHLFLLNYNQIIFSCGNKWWFDWYLSWHSRKVYIISLHLFNVCVYSVPDILITELNKVGCWVMIGCSTDCRFQTLFECLVVDFNYYILVFE